MVSGVEGLGFSGGGRFSGLRVLHQVPVSSISQGDSRHQYRVR